jgi:hypothetical protein
LRYDDFRDAGWRGSSLAPLPFPLKPWRLDSQRHPIRVRPEKKGGPQAALPNSWGFPRSPVGISLSERFSIIK